MYSTAGNFAVEPWRMSRYMDWEQRYGAWLQAQHGFHRRAITNSFSYPSHYLSVVEWDSRATAQAALTSVGHQEYMAANSMEGVITPVRPTEAFEDTVTVGNSTQVGTMYYRGEWHLDPGKGHAFEKRIRGVLELHQKISSAYYSGRLYRMMGNASRCHVGCFFTNREDWIAAEVRPEFQEFLKAHPYSAYASDPPVHEIYEIILIS